MLEAIRQFHVAFDYRINQIGISNHQCLKIKVDLWYWQELNRSNAPYFFI